MAAPSATVTANTEKPQSDAKSDADQGGESRSTACTEDCHCQRFRASLVNKDQVPGLSEEICGYCNHAPSSHNVQRRSFSPSQLLMFINMVLYMTRMLDRVRDYVHLGHTECTRLGNRVEIGRGCLQRAYSSPLRNHCDHRESFEAPSGWRSTSDTSGHYVFRGMLYIC
jgi:hypothetical protein